MMEVYEMKAFDSAVNLFLLNEIISFVFQTAEATPTQRSQISKRCIFMMDNEPPESIQTKYKFLYLGELLERYEERFGMSMQDLRAIALALGYTHELLDDKMFVGNQRDVFLRTVRASADGDVYLAAALYLLDEDGENTSEQEARLLEMASCDTEKLIFVMGLLPVDKKVLERQMPTALRMLGHERTIPLMENAMIFGWFVVWLQDALRNLRGTKTALFRALCALPTSFVKKGSKHHDTLLSFGYTPLEIVYANMHFVYQCRANGVLMLHSITAEKIAISLFEQVFHSEKPMPEAVYEQLTTFFRKYHRFQIKVGGHDGLLSAIDTAYPVENARTFAWLLTLCVPEYHAFSRFDISDPKWDLLVQSIPRESYDHFFERQLAEQDTREEILVLIACYNQKTKGDYLQSFFTEHRDTCYFKFLVKKDIINLWDAFCGSVNEAGKILSPCMIEHIQSCLYECATIHAFRFYEKFFSQYGAAGIERFFHESKYRSLNFTAGLLKSSYSSNHLSILLKREFLTEQEHLSLLQYLEEYVFACKPDEYLAFVVALLKDPFAAGLLDTKTQRSLFDLVMRWPGLESMEREHLQRRYWTQAEKDAEQAQHAAKKEQENQRKLLEIQSNLEHELSKSYSIAILKSFLSHYKYTSWCKSVCKMLQDKIPQVLRSKNYSLNRGETSELLELCTVMFQLDGLSLQEVKQYIAETKEGTENDRSGH